MAKHEWKNNLSDTTLDILIFLALISSCGLSLFKWLSVNNKFNILVVLEHIGIALGLYILICIALNELVDCRI